MSSYTPSEIAMSIIVMGAASFVKGAFGTIGSHVGDAAGQKVSRMIKDALAGDDHHDEDEDEQVDSEHCQGCAPKTNLLFSAPNGERYLFATPIPSGASDVDALNLRTLVTETVSTKGLHLIEEGHPLYFEGWENWLEPEPSFPDGVLLASRDWSTPNSGDCFKLMDAALRAQIKNGGTTRYRTVPAALGVTISRAALEPFLGVLA